jgi:hypothetical protein
VNSRDLAVKTAMFRPRPMLGQDMELPFE